MTPYKRSVVRCVSGLYTCVQKGRDCAYRCRTPSGCILCSGVSVTALRTVLCKVAPISGCRGGGDTPITALRLRLVPCYAKSHPFGVSSPYFIISKSALLLFFAEPFPSAWILCGFYDSSVILRRSVGDPSAMLAYSIGRIILSIKAISSSVRPYFLYSISSVHGWEKS